MTANMAGYASYVRYAGWLSGLYMLAIFNGWWIW
jgi:hypothetical protein